MSKYQKKSVIIEAELWDGTAEGAGPIIDWILTGQYCARWDESGIYIDTLEGTMHVSPGDYVIKGVEGEFYPCKPDIFKKTYQPVRLFVKFTEHNDWEGETWHWFLPLDGNEGRLEKLYNLIIDIDPDGDGYELDLEGPLTESEVDILVKHSDRGYCHTYNKVEGVMLDFSHSEVTYTAWDSDQPEIDLGKGSIENLFLKKES